MVLFICTANMCRSQMAEGWANYLKGDRICAFSAGIVPGYSVSRSTVEVMRAAGVDISCHYTKSVDDLPEVEFDYVITLSEEAKQYCPKFGPNTKILHIPVEDPSTAMCTAGQARQAFMQTSEQIRAVVEAMPESLLNT